MSLAISSLRDALGVPPTKVPAGAKTLISYVLPPVACYIIAAVLAVTPQRRAVRIAFWPVLALFAFRAAVSLDMSLGDPGQVILNGYFVLFMFSISINTIYWSLANKPLVRLHPANRPPSAFMDALDLASNLRGHGWNWSRGLYVPHETRPDGRAAFAFHTFLSWVADFFISGILVQAIQTFIVGPGARSSPKASTIFDDGLPFLVRYLRACIISILFAFVAQTGMEMGYHLGTTLGILLFGQEPAQWPPAFDNPWRATSLCDFWGRRWHQLYRHMFLLGAYPFSVVFGRAGSIIGAFLTSALFHHVLMTALDDRSEVWRMLVGFGMMGPGILAERTFYKLTGRKVGGAVGWVWTMTWLLLWGNVIVDGFLRGGMLSSQSAIHGLRPVRMLVDGLVIRFDAWLHSI